MKRLIVNADDFGLAESVNRGIMESHRDGILTSASLLTNGLAFEQAVALSRQLPNLSVGVHLNISEGTPLSPAGRIPTLVNEHGKLHLTPLLLSIGILAGKVRRDDIRSECRAQILRAFDVGLKPTHLDGHLHVHILPQMSSIMLDLAREFHIRHVRCPAENLEVTLPSLWNLGGRRIAALKRFAIAYGVSSFARPFRERLRVAGLPRSDAFYGLVHTGFLDAKALSALLRFVPDGVTEFMCHPGYASPELESLGGSLSRSRETARVGLQMNYQRAAAIRVLARTEL